MNILVVGAGALGGFFGGLLARAGQDVTFLARGETLRRLQAEGLTVESVPFGSFTIPVNVIESPDDAGNVDLILFSTKAYDLDEAAQRIAPLVNDRTTVIAVQNGIDHPQRLESFLGKGRIVPGAVVVSATVRSPGVIAHMGGPGLMQIGEMAPHDPARIAAIGTLLGGAGIPFETYPDIWPKLWNKFSTICAMSGVSALTRLTLRQIFDQPESRRFYRDVMDEVVQVALASGVQLPRDAADATMAMLEAMPNLPERGSMAYDLMAGRRLEIETLNGAVVRLGEQVDVQTPLNRAIAASLLPYRNGPPVLPS